MVNIGNEGIIVQTDKGPVFIPSGSEPNPGDENVLIPTGDGNYISTGSQDAPSIGDEGVIIQTEEGPVYIGGGLGIDTSPDYCPEDVDNFIWVLVGSGTTNDGGLIREIGCISELKLELSCLYAPVYHGSIDIITGHSSDYLHNGVYPPNGDCGTENITLEHGTGISGELISTDPVQYQVNLGEGMLSSITFIPHAWHSGVAVQHGNWKIWVKVPQNGWASTEFPHEIPAF